jgi:hypothetical protein
MNDIFNNCNESQTILDNDCCIHEFKIITNPRGTDKTLKVIKFDYGLNRVEFRYYQHGKSVGYKNIELRERPFDCYISLEWFAEGLVNMFLNKYNSLLYR